MAFFLNAKQLKYCECKNKHRQEEGRATGSAICTGGEWQNEQTSTNVAAFKTMDV